MACLLQRNVQSRTQLQDTTFNWLLVFPVLRTYSSSLMRIASCQNLAVKSSFGLSINKSPAVSGGQS